MMTGMNSNTKSPSSPLKMKKSKSKLAEKAKLVEAGE
jgi:hypothetical protein